MSDIKTTIRICGLLIFVFHSFVNCIAQFNVEKPNEGYSRSRLNEPKLLTPAGGDVFHTNPYVIVIADSSSPGQLSGKHLSQQLVSNYVKEIIGVNNDVSQTLGENVQFKKRFQDLSNNAVKSIQNVVTNELKKVSQNAVLSQNDQMISANFIAVTIDNSGGDYEPLLRIQQVGSARVVVFRRTQVKKQYYLLPVFGTITSQLKPQIPNQFYVFKPNSNLVLEQSHFEAALDDLVVIGSNGLWDNVHLSYMTFLLNFAMKFGQGNLNNINVLLNALTTGYQKVLEFEAESLKSTFITNYQSQIKNAVEPNVKEQQFKSLLDQIKTALPTSMTEDQKTVWISFLKIAPAAAQVLVNRPASNGLLISQDLVDLLKKIASDNTPSLSFISSDKAKFRTKLLADAAYEFSHLTKFLSPFCIESWNAGAKYEECAEVVVADDITVVAASVADADAPSKDEIDKFYLLNSLKSNEYLTRLAFDIRAMNTQGTSPQDTQQKIKALGSQLDVEIANIWSTEKAKVVLEFKDRRVLLSADKTTYKNERVTNLI